MCLSSVVSGEAREEWAMDGTLLYDGDCRFCTTTADWLHRHAGSPAPVVPWQHADLTGLGLSPAACEEPISWVDDTCHVSGPAALAAYLATSRTSWRGAARVLTAPGSRQLADPLYRFLAQHRHHLPGGLPATQRPRLAAPVPGLRLRRASDLTRCARLLRIVQAESHYPVHAPDSARDWLGGDDVESAWVVERRGQILGHAAFSTVGTRGSSAFHWREVTGREPDTLGAVTRLFVRPQARGTGLGSALVDAVEAEIRAAARVPVAEVVDVSRDARRLFQHRGWTLRSMDAWRDDPAYRLYCYEGPDLSSGGPPR
jgi:GNAT superfamily N-acetyltransferase/predicted DCC family thiol-disulfide oxidoreductase YuxK